MEDKLRNGSYAEVWHGSPLSRVKLYYSPRRENAACIVHGSEYHFFRTVDACISWAVSAGWIKDGEKALESATEEIAFVEQLDDSRWACSDHNHQMNQSIAESGGNLKDIARILRRFHSRWSI